MGIDELDLEGSYNVNDKLNEIYTLRNELTDLNDNFLMRKEENTRIKL